MMLLKVSVHWHTVFLFFVSFRHVLALRSTTKHQFPLERLFPEVKRYEKRLTQGYDTRSCLNFQDMSCRIVNFQDFLCRIWILPDLDFSGFVLANLKFCQILICSAESWILLNLEFLRFIRLNFEFRDFSRRILNFAKSWIFYIVPAESWVQFGKFVLPNSIF